MKILVPIKQVPESSNVKMDAATGTVIRTGVETVVNPLDLYAIEAALGLKERYGGEVTALSMGPPEAMRVLREAAAMGCDRCALLSDRRFGGADTWATSYTLGRGAARLGPFDLIITGERATDGDTAQVGPALAAWRGLPALTYVSKIERIEGGRIFAERLVEEGYEMLDAPVPCLLTVVKEIAVPRLPTLKGKIRSRDMDIPVFSADDLEVNPDCLGLKGSPTRVVKIDTPSISRGGRVVNVRDEESLRLAVDEVMALLTEKGIGLDRDSGGLPDKAREMPGVSPFSNKSFSGTEVSRETCSRGGVWTLAEQYQGKLKAVSFELLSRGRSLADKLGVKLSSLLIGPAASPLEELIRRGADEVIAVEDEGLRYFCGESYAAVFEALIREYAPEIILAAATSTGRTLMPYTAVKVHAGLTADCTGLDIEEGTGNLLQTRPAIGGNIMATIKTPDHRPQMATVRPRSSRPLEEDPAREGKVFRFSLGETLSGGGGFPALMEGRTRVRGHRREETGFANLEEAEVIVAGGRGLKKGENFGLLREIAGSLGGEVGASRDAVDRGWISYPHQVGLSGKTVSPKLYMGVGISGAIQHLAGIKTSETIVSINLDPDANLHKVADLAIVGDAFEVLGELRKRLNKLGLRDEK